VASAQSEVEILNERLSARRRSAVNARVRELKVIDLHSDRRRYRYRGGIRRRGRRCCCTRHGGDEATRGMGGQDSEGKGRGVQSSEVECSNEGAKARA
jgi:hypothetical protein